MKFFLLVSSFFLFSFSNLLSNDLDECNAFIDNQYNFTQDTVNFSNWSFTLEYSDDDDCVQCPPLIIVDNFGSDAGVNGLNNAQLLEINGENYLSYKSDEDFLKAANKILAENQFLSIKAIFDDEGFIWDLEDTEVNFSAEDYDFDLIQADIDKEFQSLFPVKFEVEIADIEIEDKSSIVSILLNISYFYNIPNFSDYALSNIDFKQCTFIEHMIPEITEKIFIPRIFNTEETSNIQNFYDQDKKKRINEITFIKAKSDVDIYVNETLIINSKPVTEFSKFPYDSLLVSIAMAPTNFISKDYKEEDWLRVERNTLNNISLNEWDLHDIEIFESALDKQFMFSYLEEDEEYSYETKKIIKKTFDNFGVIEFLFIDLILDRKHQFYNLKVIIPVFFIVLISFSTFWIRNEQIEAKLNLAIVSLLALIAYNFIVNNDIPKIDDITVLDSFILISYMFTGFCSILSVYSYFDYRRDKLTGDFNPIDIKLRFLAPLIYVTSTIIMGLFIYFEILFFS